MRRTSCLSSRRWLLSWALVAFVAGAGRSVPAAASTTTVSTTAHLQCSIVDAVSGAPLAARCRLIDIYGNNRYPPFMSCFYHTASGGYFYTGGSFDAVVPLGRVIVTVKHGFEYAERVDTVVVRADTSIAVGLQPIVSMAGVGWYSGDTHLHINHAGGYYTLDPAAAHLMGRAEGLNMVNCLDNEYHFTGASDPCSTPDCVVFMSEEWRSSSWGHVGMPGLRSLVDPVSSMWWPLVMDAADSAHARPGALVICDHPIPSDQFMQVEDWPGNGIARELPVDCIGDRVDAIDVMSYSNCHNGGVELDLWYRLLNCGFRLPASAGTDAVMNRIDTNPLGGFRTYAYLGDDIMSASAWFAALAAGRSFITNGPLVTRFEVNGRSIGDSMSFAAPGAALPVEVGVRSAWPVDRIEIVRSGVVAATVDLAPPRCSVDTSVSVIVPESSWIALRVHGALRGWIPIGDCLCAHTSPVYVTIGGRRVVEREDAAYFVAWIEDLELLARTKGSWPDTLQSSRVFRELAAARAFYEALASTPAGAQAAATPSALRLENMPNPFGDGTVLTFEVPSAAVGDVGGEIPVSLAIYDVSGRLLRTLVDAPVASGRHGVAWDGRDARGRRAPSGIYFARLSGRGGVFTRKLVIIR